MNIYFLQLIQELEVPDLTCDELKLPVSPATPSLQQQPDYLPIVVGKCAECVHEKERTNTTLLMQGKHFRQAGFKASGTAVLCGIRSCLSTAAELQQRGRPG